MAYNFTIDTPNPMQGINNALQTYGNVRQMQFAEEQANMQRQEWQQKQQALAAQQEKGRRYQESLEDLAENPTPKNILRHSALFPEAYEANASLFKSADTEAQKRMTQRASNLTMMLNSGDTEGAMKYIDSLKQAADNSGNKEQSDFFEIALEMGRRDPNSLQLLSTQMLMSTEDGRKIVEGLADKEKATAETRKLGAETREINQKISSAMKTSGLDQADAVVDFINKGGSYEVAAEILGKDNQAVKAARYAADLKKAEAEGNAVEAEAARVGLESAKEAAAQKLREASYQASQAQFEIDEIIQIAQRIANNPETNNVLGAIEGQKTVDDVASFFGSATLRDAITPYGPLERVQYGGNRKDLRIQAITDIEQLRSRLTLETLKQLKRSGATLGATNETEIGLLMSSKENIDRRKGEKHFRKMLDSIITSSVKLKTGIGELYGKDVPPVESNEFLNQPDLNQQVEAALQKYPGV